MTVTTVARYTTRPGERARILGLLAPARAATLDEEGCEYFHTLISDDAPDSILLVEGWADEHALQRHRLTAHFNDIVVGTIAPALLARDVSVLSDAFTTRGAVAAP
jgi:quinol monooxygenase YgiN